MAAGAAKFSLDKSQVKDDTLAAFIAGRIEDNIRTVPGVGPVAADRLAAAGVSTTYQLIGKFLMFRSPGISTQQHCDDFWSWLAEIGISSHRSGIVRAIAEKVNTLMPGVYKEEELASA